MNNVSPLLEIKKGGKVFTQIEKLILFKNLNFKIMPQDFICVQGVSGVGKSTLLHILGLIENLTEGELYFQGRKISGLKDSYLSLVRREFIGFVFQFHHLLADFTVLENAMMPLILQGKNQPEHREWVKKLLELVGMSHRLKHLPKEISGGERQRIALVRSLSHQPNVLFADEPSGNLDQKNTEYLCEILTKIHEEFKTTIVLVTHDPILGEIAKTSYKMDGGFLKQ